MKHRVAMAAKFLVPIAILAWLFWTEWDAISRMASRPKDWRLLLVCLATLLTAVLLTFGRWYLLVRALEIPFTVRDALRLSFLGYLFNFVGPSSVGGDLIKVYFVAKDHREHRGEVIATILLDRCLGMFSLMLVATIALQVVDLDRIETLGQLSNAVTFVCAVGAAGIIALLLPSRFTDWLFDPMSRLRLVGPFVRRVRSALALYRSRWHWLLAILAMGVAAHALLAVTIHFADRAVHPVTPRLTEHFVISPLAMVATAAPVPGGLGTYEFAMNFLYEKLPSQTMEEGQGFSVAVLYRLLTIVIAAIGVVYYWLNRSEISQAVSALETEHVDR